MRLSEFEEETKAGKAQKQKGQDDDTQNLRSPPFHSSGSQFPVCSSSGGTILLFTAESPGGKTAPLDFACGSDQ